MNSTPRHVLGAALLGAAAWWGPGAAAHVPAVARAIDVALRLEGRGDVVALTFDDGPHPEGTPAVLEILARAGASATFFLVGEQARRYPGLVREIVAAGHHAAVHADRHRSQMRLSPGEVGRDLARAVDTIGELTAARPRLYRPPYGAFTAGGRAVVRHAGLEPLLWSKWGRDWRGESEPNHIAQLATEGLAAGDVVLLHDADWYCTRDAHRRMLRALPPILEAVAMRGFRAVAA